MSAKNTDKHGRLRDKTVAFRVSQAEADALDARVAASGMTKQDFLISCIEDKEVRNNPSPRTYKMLKKYMVDIYVELRRMRSADEIDESVIEILQILTRAFCDIGEEELKPKDGGIAEMDAAMFKMMRG